MAYFEHNCIQYNLYFYIVIGINYLHTFFSIKTNKQNKQRDILNISAGHFIIQNIFSFHWKQRRKFIYLLFRQNKCCSLIFVFIVAREFLFFASLFLYFQRHCSKWVTHSIKTVFFVCCQIVQLFCEWNVWVCSPIRCLYHLGCDKLSAYRKKCVQSMCI